MYNNLINLLTEENEKRKAEMTAYICNEESTDSLRCNSTETRWNQFIKGLITREQANEYALKRAFKAIDATTKKALEKIARAQGAAAVAAVDVFVEWHKSRTWGYNPTAYITVRDTDGRIYEATGTASGCGYDKESAAVADALNNIDCIKKMLFDCKEAAILSGKGTSSHACISYGAGYGVLPYFEGGVGMIAHEQIFRSCGLNRTTYHGTKHADHYYFS